MTGVEDGKISDLFFKFHKDRNTMHLLLNSLGTNLVEMHLTKFTELSYYLTKVVDCSPVISEDN